MLRMKGIRMKGDHHARTPSCSLSRIAADCPFTESGRGCRCLPEMRASDLTSLGRTLWSG